MTTTIADVLDGLGATLTDETNGISGLRFFPVSSGPVPTPSVVVASITVTPNVDTDGAATFKVELTIVSDRRGDDDISNLLELLEPSSPLSVPAVLEGAPTLGGKVADLTITEIGSLRELEVGGAKYWGGSIDLEIDGLGDYDDIDDEDD